MTRLILRWAINAVAIWAAITLLRGHGLELAQSGWSGSVTVQPYDGATNCCVLAIMGSPDAADSLTLSLNVDDKVLRDILLVCIIPIVHMCLRKSRLIFWGRCMSVFWVR